MWNVFSAPAKDTNQSLTKITCVDICFDETVFAIGTLHDGIQLWSSQEKKAIKTFKTDYHARSIAFLNDNQQLAILDNKRTCYMLDLQTAEKTSISLSGLPDKLYYDGLKYEDNELKLITSDKQRKNTYQWAISSFKEPIKLKQEYMRNRFYSQNMIKTSDNYVIREDSKCGLLVSLAQNPQKCIQALKVPYSYQYQPSPYLAYCSNLVLIWRWQDSIMIVDITGIKEKLKSM